MLFLLLPARAWAVDATIWAELARVAKLEARFTQVQHRAILKQPLTSSGEVRFERAGPKLAWTVTTPSRSSFLLDGAVAKMEYPDLGMSETIDLAQVPDASRLATSLLVWMQADAAAVERDFVATYGDDAASLKPRDEQLAALISEIRVRFAPGPWRVREVALREPDGDRVEIAFRSVVLDGKAAPDP
ncbi:MAG: outer membrane lipoprotein carrier protein LolA [Myxococcota bacterium]